MDQITEQEAASNVGRWSSAGTVHGTLIAAAVLGAGGLGHAGERSVVSVVAVTLVVTWLAHSYCEVIASQVRSQHHLRREDLTHALREELPILTGGLVPLTVFVVADLSRSYDTADAVRMALYAAVFELLYAGATAGRAAGRRGLVLVAYACAAGALGVALVAAEIAVAH